MPIKAFLPTAFGDKMEDGEAYWTADAPWQRIYTDYYSPSYAWSDSPGGNYALNADVALTSVTIDLSAAKAPKLIFRHHYDFKNPRITAGWKYPGMTVSRGRSLAPFRTAP